MRGFTFIEVIISLAITVILTTVIIVGFFNFRSRQILDIESKKMAASIREGRERAVTQQGSSRWGLHFENPAGSRDFYQLFSGATYTTTSVSSTSYLNPGVRFSNPAEGVSTTVIFAKISGLPDAPASVTIELISGVSSSTITIDAQGRVSF